METTFYGAHVVTVMWLFTISLGNLVSKWCERPQQAVEDLWGKREKYMEDILAFGPSPVLVKPHWHITGTLSVWEHMATCTALLSPWRRGWELISFRMNSSRRWSLPLNSLFMPFMTCLAVPEPVHRSVRPIICPWLLPVAKPERSWDIYFWTLMFGGRKKERGIEDYKCLLQ